MRAGLSTRTVEPALTSGLDGIGVYTAALLAHLPRHDVVVHGYTFPPGRVRPALRHTGWLPRPYAWYAATALLGVPARIAPPVDLMHFTDYRVAAARVPSVATVHDAIPFMRPEWVSPRLRRLKNHALRRMVGLADLYIAVSHFAVAELREHYRLPEDRIRVVPNGIDEEWLAPPPPDAPALRRSHGLPESPYFLFVGTLQPRKNVERILQAFLALPAAVRGAHPLVVIGRAGWSCEEIAGRLRTLAARGEVVWVAGMRERAALRAAYHGALALAFPTLYEGFGIPVVEAFASGTPVLTSTAGSLPEVAGDAALLVDPCDEAAIAAAMLRLAEDGGLRARLAAAGRERARRYTWDATAAATAAVYRELAPARAG